MTLPRARYLKLWFKPGTVTVGDDKPATAGLYEITSESKHMLSGRKINRRGEDDSYERKDGVIIERIHVIQRSTIRRQQEWVWNRKYAELEPVKR